MGVPVVLSDQGGAREMVNDGVHGFVFPTGDTPALVDALRRLHPLDARARMGAQAAEQVATCFRPARMGFSPVRRLTLRDSHVRIGRFSE